MFQVRKEMWLKVKRCGLSKQGSDRRHHSLADRAVWDHPDRRGPLGGCYDQLLAEQPAPNWRRPVRRGLCPPCGGGLGVANRQCRRPAGSARGGAGPSRIGRSGGLVLGQRRLLRDRNYGGWRLNAAPGRLFSQRALESRQGGRPLWADQPIAGALRAPGVWSNHLLRRKSSSGLRDL